MRTFLAIVQIILCVLLIVVVLLQHRKQGGFSGIFGGGTHADAGQWQRFTALSKLTVILATIFMILSIVLVMISK